MKEEPLFQVRCLRDAADLPDFSIGHIFKINEQKALPFFRRSDDGIP